MFIFMIIQIFYIFIPKTYSMLPLIVSVTNVIILCFISFEQYIIYIKRKDFQKRLEKGLIQRIPFTVNGGG